MRLGVTRCFHLPIKADALIIIYDSDFFLFEKKSGFKRRFNRVCFFVFHVSPVFFEGK